MLRSHLERGQHSWQIKSLLSWTSSWGLHTSYFKDSTTSIRMVLPWDHQYPLHSQWSTFIWKCLRIWQLEPNRCPGFGKGIVMMPYVWLKRWCKDVSGPPQQLMSYRPVHHGAEKGWKPSFLGHTWRRGRMEVLTLKCTARWLIQTDTCSYTSHHPQYVKRRGLTPVQSC